MIIKLVGLVIGVVIVVACIVLAAKFVRGRPHLWRWVRARNKNHVRSETESQGVIIDAEYTEYEEEDEE